MTKEEIRALITEIGIIPAVRLRSAEDALFAAQTICDSGIPIVEVTMTVHGALKVIAELAKHYGGALIVGAGTVFDVATAQQCLDAGAGFLTTPGPDLEIVDFAVRHGAVVFPGALTPFVKIFPCAQVGGPTYIQALKAPFREVPLIASGGVNQETAVDFIRAGAAALGIGGNLLHPDAIKRRDGGWIRELARRYLNLVKQARSPE